MKTSTASIIVLVIILLFSLHAASATSQASTLSAQLNTTINTIDWSSPTSWVIPHFSLIFTGQNTYDAALPTIPDFKTLIQTKRIAELDDVNSSLLDQQVARALGSQQMVGHWPNVDPHVMLVYWKFLAMAYTFAIDLGVNNSKWDRDLAFQEYWRCWQVDPDFLWFNPEEGIPTDFSDRYYDENAQVLSIFLKFYQIGVPDAINYANQMWTHLFSYHWSGSYFPYRGSSGQVECEAGPFAETMAELNANNGRALPNFPDYLLKDLDYKFISGGNWSGRLWSPGAFVVRHAESNPQKRLENTVTAWAAMHSYYGMMDDSMRSDFIRLLTGSPKAWQGLIDYSNLYKDGRFRWKELENYTDDATCGGAMTLFLNGIVPNSGSLAIPVIDETYEDWYSMFPASHFRFDYGSRTIRIPVWAGKIDFIFGTGTASYNFPDDGIYEVYFATDWNTVTGANQISPLSDRFKYLNPRKLLPVHNVDTGFSYGGIQEAINANETLSGHTIRIDAGTYNENIVVNKSLTLAGEDRDTTIVSADGAVNATEVIADNVTITGLTIQDSGGTASASACGFVLKNVTKCKIFQNKITENWDGILLDHCSDNVVFQNTITGNINDGVSLLNSPGNDIFCNNITSNNCGIQLRFSLYNDSEELNVIHDNNFANNTFQTDLFNTVSLWDGGYPSGGNYWSDYSGTDLFSGPFQNCTGYDGIGDSLYVVDQNNADHYPLMYPAGSTNITVTTVTSSNALIVQGHHVSMNGTVENDGNRIQVFSLSVHANSTVIHSEQVTLLPKTSLTFAFIWDTTGFAYGNYTVTCCVQALPDENDILNNAYVCVTPIHVSIPGDVSGPIWGVCDRVVNLRDISYLIVVFNARPSSPNWNSTADLNNDGIINMRDLQIAIINFDRHE